MRCLLLVLLLWTLTSAGSLSAQNLSQKRDLPPQIRVSTRLVVEAITVKDKRGKPIQELTAKDFTLTENGVLQKIQFCEPQDLDVTETHPQPQPVSEGVTIYEKLPKSHIDAEVAGSLRYKDHRLLALYFDMTAMPPPDQLRALAAAQKFISTNMRPTDLIAILRYSSGSVDVLQDFTADRDRLLSILETMTVGEGQGFEESPFDASTSDTGGAFGQDDSEFNIFNTDRQLSALQTAAQMLGRLSEKKSLIYFASGLMLNGVDNQAQLHATIDAAVRADVSLWPIDARGLEADAPLGGATTGSPAGIGMYSGASALAVTTNFERSQDTLYALAADTGGKALLDYNDLTKGITEAQDSISSYYILGYYTTNGSQDGRFRRIRITLRRGIAASLDYRQGYYATKRFSRFNAADKDRQLEDALMLEDPITDLTLAVEIDYFQLNRAEYFVPVIIKIPGRELAIAKRHGAEHTLIDFIGEIKDSYDGITVTNVRDRVNTRLDGATATVLAKRPIEYDTGFTLLPGRYTIKILARDDETGRIGTYQTDFVIPNLNNEQKRVPISSVVLSSQRVDISDALYSVMKNNKEEAVDPLVENGQKLIPSVTRVFRKSREIYVYLEAYEQDSFAVEPLIIFASFYQAQTKIFETQPMEVITSMNNSLKTMPLLLTINLGQLPPGQYDCQVTVLDPSEQKASFWRAPLMLVP